MEILEFGGERQNSKKNNVVKYALEENGMTFHVVDKIFSDNERFQNELNIMGILSTKEINIPKMLDVEKQIKRIRYLYIDSMTMLEYLENNDSEEFMAKIFELSKWLSKFYKILSESVGKSIIMGDIHLRNFLISYNDGEIFGLDFEECRDGKPESDVARLSVFILTYDPAYTDIRKNIVIHFIKSMQMHMKLDMHLLEMEMKRELIELGERRKCDTKSEIIDEIFDLID